MKKPKARNLKKFNRKLIPKAHPEFSEQIKVLENKTLQNNKMFISLNIHKY